MPSPIMRRLRAVEARQGVGVKKNPMAMTDDEIWRALNIRDPETGALRKDLTDEELDERIRAVEERIQEDG